MEISTTGSTQTRTARRKGRQRVLPPAPSGILGYLHRLCRLLPRTQELLDRHAGARIHGLRQGRPGLGALGRVDRLRYQQIRHGHGLRPQQRPRLHPAGIDRLGAHHDLHGRAAMGVDLDSRRHHGDVLPAVRQRLDAGHGLAPLRACHDALVLHQGTRREDVGVERGAQHRRSGDGSARRIRYYVGVHAFRRPAGRRFLCSGTRRAGDRRNRLSHGARYAAIVRPPAHRDLETRNQAILRLEREGDDRAADSIRKCIE